MLRAFAARLLPYAAGAAIVFPMLIWILLMGELSGEFSPESKQVDLEEARILVTLGLLGTFVLGTVYALAVFVTHQHSGKRF